MTRTTPKPYAGPRTLAWLGVLLAMVAAVATVFGIGYVLAGLGTETVHVQPQLTDASRAQVGLSGLPARASATPVDDTVDLALSDSPSALVLGVRAPTLLGALGVAVGALLLRRIVSGIGRGRPFERAAVRAVGWLAVVVVVVGVAVPVLDDLATVVALDRAGLVEPGSPFIAGVSVPFLPILVSLLALCLAEAWRRGAAMSDDLEGLV